MDVIGHIIKSMSNEFTVNDIAIINNIVKNPSVIGRIIDTVLDGVFDGKDIEENY